MQGRNFLDKLATLAPEITEYQAVCNYKTNSSIYTNARKAYQNEGGDKNQRKAMEDLQNATTFAAMLKIISQFDIPDHVPLFQRGAFHAVITVGSIFSNSASLTYFMTQLKNDITKAAVEKGYCQEKSKEKSFRSEF